MRRILSAALALAVVALAGKPEPEEGSVDKYKIKVADAAADNKKAAKTAVQLLMDLTDKAKYKEEVQLQMMQKKVIAEGEKEEEQIKKVHVLLQTGGSTLKQSIADAVAKSPQFESEIEAISADRVQLAADIIIIKCTGEGTDFSAVTTVVTFWLFNFCS